ncbi:MAG: hypothetical protein V3V72_13755 [Ignavibacteriaceae bacterium]
MNFETIIDNEFVMSFVGMLVWFGLSFGSQSKLKFPAWFNRNSKHILIGCFVAFAIVAYDDDIIEGYNDLPIEDIEQKKYWYLLGGVWLNLLYKIASNISALINYITNKFTLK